MKSSILLLVVLGSCLLYGDAKAATLFGKVIDVNSGDLITISNLNRPVRVKLLGIDAPEMNQAFGDVAKKHLADLVYDKSVVIEYSGIAADHSLAGRVLLNDKDIGAQMIRDGAAWFDPNNQSRLSMTDREVYQRSQQAAQSERRGLWQATDPIAPWEFVKSETLRKYSVASLNPTPAKTPRRSGPVPELTNLTLMMAGMSAAAPRQTTPDADTAWARSTTRKNWSQLQPPGENFSVLIPEEGERRTAEAPYGDKMAQVNTYMVRDGWALYTLAWLTGPTYGETDQAALSGSLEGFLKGAAQGYQQGSGLTEFNCKPQGQKNISQNGYTGLEFDLSSCTLPARVRMYTRVVGDQRQLYVGAVLYGEEDENVARFLQSFTIKAKPRKG